MSNSQPNANRSPMPCTLPHPTGEPVHTRERGSERGASNWYAMVLAALLAARAVCADSLGVTVYLVDKDYECIPDYSRGAVFKQFLDKFQPEGMSPNMVLSLAEWQRDMLCPDAGTTHPIPHGSPGPGHAPGAISPTAMMWLGDGRDDPGFAL